MEKKKTEGKPIEKIIEIPEGVEVVINDRQVTVKGPKGELCKDFDDPRFNKKITIEKNKEKMIIKTQIEKRKVKAMLGTIVSHIKNMINGVTKGYHCTLTIHYVHFPITVDVKDGKVLIKNFLGEKGARMAKILGNVEVKVEKGRIILSGINKEDVGQTAANIEGVCKLSKRDRRIFQDGIFITEKVCLNE